MLNQEFINSINPKYNFKIEDNTITLSKDMLWYFEKRAETHNLKLDNNTITFSDKSIIKLNIV